MRASSRFSLFQRWSKDALNCAIAMIGSRFREQTMLAKPGSPQLRDRVSNNINPAQQTDVRLLVFAAPATGIHRQETGGKEAHARSTKREPKTPRTFSVFYVSAQCSIQMSERRTDYGRSLCERKCGPVTFKILYYCVTIASVH